MPEDLLWRLSRPTPWAPTPRGNTVAIIGAGFDQYMDPCTDMPPPLESGFFQRGLVRPIGDTVNDLVSPILDYIRSEFRRDRQSLEALPFSIESLLTHIDYQLSTEPDGTAIHARLTDIQLRLLTYIVRVLSLEDQFHTPTPVMTAFASYCLRTSATVFSFNYTTFLERAMEGASGQSARWLARRGRLGQSGAYLVDDEGLQTPLGNWTSCLGYGLTFDLVQTPWLDGSMVDGSRYYSLPGNSLYLNPVLKLHGSLNWFAYPAEVQMFRHNDGGPSTKPELRGRRLVLAFRPPDMFDPGHPSARALAPVIVPPTGPKDAFLANEIFRRLWTSARESLARCQRLISVGYSYRESDFRIMSELRRAFADRPLEELVVVNPTTRSLDLLREICQPVVWRHYSNLTDFVMAELASIRPDGDEYYSEHAAKPGMPLGPQRVVVRCRTCDPNEPSGSTMVDFACWEDAVSRARAVEWTVCRHGHTQLSGSGDKDVIPPSS
jgi:hypothetical protein